MADVVKSESTLKFRLLFVDGDDRTITLKNPKATIPNEQITALNALIQSGNMIIGDKTGATFGKIGKATKVTTQKRYLDWTTA